MKAKDEELRLEMANLREDFNNKKRELEAELRLQFGNDIAFLRQELEKVRSAEKPEPEIVIKTEPPIQTSSQQIASKPIPAMRKKSASATSNASPTFLKEIEGIEADIKQLRSQVKMGGSSQVIMESDDTSSMMTSDEEQPGIYLPNKSRHERFATPVDMAIYPSGKNGYPGTLAMSILKY